MHCSNLPSRLICLALVAVLFPAVLGTGCSGDGGGADTLVQEDVPEAPQDTRAGDLQPEIAGDLQEQDLAQDIVTVDPRLRVGMSQTPLGAPVGISTAGYGQSPGPEYPDSPLTGNFIASTREHFPVTSKALWLEKGEQRMAMARLETIGVTQDIVRAVEDELSETLGQDMHGKVVLSGTHTHLGPGRLSKNMMWEIAADSYWRAFYLRVTENVVKSILQARENARPARIGHGRTECPDCHLDRRCNNPEFKDSRMWVVRFDDDDTGAPLGFMVNFAVHGTALGWQDAIISGDTPGLIEQKIEERLQPWAPVMFINAWAGDMRPAHPSTPVPEFGCKELPGSFDRMEAVGFAAANAFESVASEIATTPETDFGVLSLGVPLSREAIGYADGEFPYEDGGMICGNGEGVCYEEGEPPDMSFCIPLPEGVMNKSTVLAVGTIGDLAFFTLPGEPHTDFALGIVESLEDRLGDRDVAAFGYSQDHLGYLMKEYDFLWGGYEASMVPWGPREGDYLASRVEEMGEWLTNPEYIPAFEVQELVGPYGAPLNEYTPAENLSEPGVVVEPEEALATGDLVRFEFLGGDPWLGNPRVSVEIKSGEEWIPLTQPDGRVLSSDTYRILLELQVTPDWGLDKSPQPRDFRWIATLASDRNVPCPGCELEGELRLVAEGKAVKASGETEDYSLTSRPFVVTRP